MSAVTIFCALPCSHNLVLSCMLTLFLVCWLFFLFHHTHPFSCSLFLMQNFSPSFLRAFFLGDPFSLLPLSSSLSLTCSCSFSQLTTFFLVLVPFLSTCSLSRVPFWQLPFSWPHPLSWDHTPFLSISSLLFLMLSHSFSRACFLSCHTVTWIFIWSLSLSFFELYLPLCSVSPSFFLFPLVLPHSCSLSDTISFLPPLSHTQIFLHACFFTHLLTFAQPYFLYFTLMPFLMPLLPFLRLHCHSFLCPHAHFLALPLPLSWELPFSQVLPFYLARTHYFSHAHSFSWVVLLFLVLASFLTSCLMALHLLLHPLPHSHDLMPFLTTSLSLFLMPLHSLSCTHFLFLANLHIHAPSFPHTHTLCTIHVISLSLSKLFHDLSHSFPLPQSSPPSLLFFLSVSP